MGATGAWTIDESRHARETLPPAIYLNASYYEIWIRALEKLLLDHGLVEPGEIESEAIDTPPGAVKRVLRAPTSGRARGGFALRQAGLGAAALSAGDRVRARNDHLTTHTRLPRYVRGRIGEIVENQGAFVFPDTNAHGKGENPAWCYTCPIHGRGALGPGCRSWLRSHGRLLGALP